MQRIHRWASLTFVVDDVAAEAIRRAWHEEGDLASIVELRRHFPGITDYARAWSCVQVIVGWAQHPAPEQEPDRD